MAFDTLSDRLNLVANSTLTLCRQQWGAQGLRKEEEIASSIGWRPTFYMRPSKALIVAVEVSDVIYPELLKIAAHDIEHYDFPIAVYQACSLDIYQRDPNMTKANMLRDHGFGCITVDGTGSPTIQWRAPPIAQNIIRSRVDADLKSLTPKLKVGFRTAYATYQTNVGQGLQEAGQIVEALIDSITEQAISAAVVPPRTGRS